MLTERAIGAAVSWGFRQIQKRVEYSPSNPYLEGAFAPVKAETTATRLTVRGTLPQELQGILPRIGPNPAHVENPAAELPGPWTREWPHRSLTASSHRASVSERTNAFVAPYTAMTSRAVARGA